MDFIVRVDINVNGLAEEEFTPEMAQILMDSYVQYPSWVQEYKVRAVRELRCFEAVREMLMNGTPTIEVARQVHLLNEWKDKKLETARSYLEHFRTTLPKTQMLARMVPTQYLEVKEKVDKSLDCLATLEEAVGWMKERILIGLKRERVLEFLLPGMEKQFAVLTDMVAQAHAIKKDLTGDQTAIAADMNNASAAVNRVDWSKVYSTPNAQEVMSDPERRARLVRFTENMTKLYGRMDPEQQQRVIDATKEKVYPAGEKQN